MRTKYLILFSICLAFMSCDSKRVFDEYKSVSDAWNKDEVIQFSINNSDSITSNNLFVNLRTTNAYKFNNIFLIVEMNFPHGKVIKDTLEYRMAAPNGELLGTGMLGVKEHKLWYKESVVFNEAGDYVVNIQHAMRENGEVQGVNVLEGVSDVGFRIEKAN